VESSLGAGWRGEVRREWLLGFWAGLGGAEAAWSRHSSTVKGKLMRTPSVVLLGDVQNKSTRLPIRLAVRFVTTVGRCSEGGLGMPGLAHPARRPEARSAAAAAQVAWREEDSGMERPGGIRRKRGDDSVWLRAFTFASVAPALRCADGFAHRPRPEWQSWQEILGQAGIT
jgi:hypothetical protein